MIFNLFNFVFKNYFKFFLLLNFLCYAFLLSNYGLYQKSNIEIIFSIVNKLLKENSFAVDNKLFICLYKSKSNNIDLKISVMFVYLTNIKKLIR